MRSTVVFASLTNWTIKQLYPSTNHQIFFAFRKIGKWQVVERRQISGDKGIFYCFSFLRVWVPLSSANVLV